MSFSKAKTSNSHPQKKPLSEETISALEQLGAILHRVRLRMRAEGYDIIDGIVVKISDHKQVYEQETTKNRRETSS